MLKIFLVLSLVSQFLAQDDVEIIPKFSGDEKVTFNATASTNKSSTTEPSAQSQEISKTFKPNENDTLVKRVKGNDEFRPSPQVKEIIYEKNMFPVKPAYPEAKYSNSREAEYDKKPETPWTQTGNQAWISPVKFPEHPVQTSKDRPYKFVENHGRGYQGFSGKNDYGSGLQRPQIDLGSKVPVSSSGSGTGIGSSWDISGSLYPDPKYVHKKPYAGYDFGGYVAKPTGIEHHEHHGSYEYPMKKYDNPWKKIIKILAAFIPIGLLISALTPTIITVSPVNNTMMRSRNENQHATTVRRLVSSLGYFDEITDKDCENRILCELLLSASSSQNAEQHVENFLSNFSDREKYTTERVGELKKIFEAVKRRNCEIINCKAIRENT